MIEHRCRLLHAAMPDDPATLQHVMSDLAQGEKAGVDSTPTLFFNSRKYEGPMHPKYIEMWIDEELAVNR